MIRTSQVPFLFHTVPTAFLQPTMISNLSKQLSKDDIEQFKSKLNTPLVPLEIIDHMCHFISNDPKTLCKLSLTCQSVKTISDKDEFWKPLLHRRFPSSKSIITKCFKQRYGNSERDGRCDLVLVQQQGKLY